MSTKSIIVHYHIFKNAGTSVDYALKNTFGDKWTSFEGEHSTDILPMEALRTLLDTNPAITVVSSHLARPPLPYKNCLPIVFLRHPILRAKSVYEFVKKDSTQPNHKLALNGFCEYVRWALSANSIGGVVIKNYQVIHLSDASFRTKSILNATAQPTDLQQAKNLLFSWPAFGIVEFYEKSITLLQTRYSEFIPDLKLPIVHINRTNAHPNTSIQSSLEAIREELGDKLFNALCSANSLDLRLYYSCVNRFLVTYSQVSGIR
jgi:hypothetical protein